MTETTRSGASSTESAAGGPPKATGDFDFLVGGFDVVNRRLMKPLTGCTELVEFPAATTGWTYFNGAVSIDETHFPTRGFSAMSIRLFEPNDSEWTAYWVDSRTGTLQGPVRGRWVGGVGLLFGEDEHDGRPVRIRCRLVRNHRGYRALGAVILGRPGPILGDQLVQVPAAQRGAAG